MSQAETIYRILSESKNQAANKTLMTGLRLAESPYQVSLLETLLDRGDGRTTEELIQGFYHYPIEWQNLMLAKIDGLYMGLRRASMSESIELRKNALTIIQKSQYLRLADVVVTLLRDREKTVADLAANTLIELARPFHTNPIAMPVPPKIPPKEKTRHLSREEIEKIKRINRETTDRQLFSISLQNALAQFDKVHHRVEVILAAMYFAPACWQFFWKDYLEPHQPVGECVRRILEVNNRGDLARFTLSAFLHQNLRMTAAKAVGQTTLAPFILALANQLHENSTPEIQSGLKLIQHAEWMYPENLKLDEYYEDEQQNLVWFIQSLGVNRDEVLDYLNHYIDKTTESIHLKMIDLTEETTNSTAAGTLRRILHCRFEEAAKMGLLQLIRMKSPHLPHIMAEQLKSQHESVRDLAQQYYRKKAFFGYWNRFNQLSHVEKLTAGRAIMKIDSSAVGRWKHHALMKNAQDRLKAAMILRLLNKVDESADVMLELTGDPDEKVRSCAVAALGEMHDDNRLPVMDFLRRALKDKDHRVKANAIDSLSKKGSINDVELIETLTRHHNSRVRANAIKAMINWKVKSTNKAVMSMLTDQRVEHKRSGYWLQKHLLAATDTIQKELKNTRHGKSAVTV